MDFVLELILNIIGDLLVDVIGDLLIERGLGGATRALVSRAGRAVVGLVLGGGVGLLWGNHLDGGAHWPKLLWVSLALAVVALLRLASAPPPRREGPSFREILVPPWQWHTSRLLTFVAINVGIAVGICLGFRSHLRPALG